MAVTGHDGAKIVRNDAGGVTTLTLTNPPANALDMATKQLLGDLFEEFGSGAAETRCIVLTGAGPRFFCAGGDVKELDTMDGELASERVRKFHRALRAMERLEVPVACAVNGDAVGGGSELCLFADYRVGVAHARFGLPEVNHGLLPAAISIRRAIRVLGLREARRLLFEGRLIGAEEAARIGLIDAVVRDAGELQRVVREWADAMAGKPQTLVRALKRTMRLAGDVTDDELLEMTLSDFRAYFGSEEVRAAMRAVIDRWRRPASRR